MKHLIEIKEGPCDRQSHYGEKCRISWIECNCQPGVAIDKHHSLIEDQAMSYSYIDAKNHQKGI